MTQEDLDTCLAILLEEDFLLEDMRNNPERNLPIGDDLDELE